jgi:hypothetical protein
MFLMFFLLGLSPHLQINEYLDVYSGVDTNPVYYDGASKSDFFFSVDPNLDIYYKKKVLGIGLKSNLKYKKYFRVKNQSFLNYNINPSLDVNLTDYFNIFASNNYFSASDPILLETESRAEYYKNNFYSGIKYEKDSFGFFTSFKHNYTRYKLSTFNQFNNYKMYIDLKLKYKFLPETSIFFGGRWGKSSYDEDYVAGSFYNSNSNHYEGFLGMEGRLTNTMLIYLETAFLLLKYKDSFSFHEPTFKLKITDILSEKDFLSFGFERYAYDSYYSNLYLDQKVFIELKSIFFDNIVSLSKFQYIYRNYFGDNTRLDHRVNLGLEFAVPLFKISKISRNVSFFTSFDATWVSSDAYDNFGFYTGPDLTANYKNFTVCFGLTTKY